jgi:DNA-binding CsgD family transcriptional regulator
MARAEEVGAEGARYSMVYGLAQYLTLVGRLDEARERVEPLLRRPAPVEHFRQWATLISAMAMAMLGDVDAASPLAEGVLDYGLQASDYMAVAMASWVLALVRLSQGRVGEARVAVDTISSTAWAMGPVWMAWLLEGAAAVSIAEGDLPGARATARQLAASLPEVNIAIGRVVEASLVDVLVELGELDEAKARLVEAVRSTDREVAPAHRARALIALARVSRRTEHLADAGEHLHEALAISHAMGHKRGVVDVLELLGACAAEQGSHAEAVRLLAAADTIRHETGYVYRPPTQQAEYSATESETRSALGPEFDDRWSDGAALSWDEACEYAARGRGERKRPATGWDALTPMEAKVASAVAEGLTNSEVGARLFISKHTVDSHLRHIYSKLGVSNRAELATRVARRDGAGA